MKSVIPARRALIPLAALAAMLLAAFPGAVVHASPVVWTGSGTSANWSDGLNWSPQSPPADGDDVVFGTAPSRTSSVFDLSRSFSSLSFNANAPVFTTHVLGDGAQMAFSGLGIRSLDTVGAPTGRQAFFADAGSAGGTILFTNSSGINVGSYQFVRPVDITAQGGSVAGAVGGRIVFQDSSTTSDSSFDVLRATGASVAGAGGGQLSFRDNALITRLASVVAEGGSSNAALGGQASFADQAQSAGGVSILAGQSGGLGGRVDFSDHAVALGTSGVTAEGGTSALAGSEAMASFRGDATFMGAAYLGAGRATGANGGRIDFYDRSSHDTTSFPATPGTLGIYNVGAVTPGASGGALVLHDDASIRGSHLAIYNQTAEFLAPGALAGSTSFLDRSRAGQVTIENAGAAGAGATGGVTYFRNQSSAENASIVSLGGTVGAAGGGRTAFSDNASAGAASLRNAGGSDAGARGGTLDFRNASNAGSATIINAAGDVAGAAGGATTFADSAGAGHAYISNQTSLGAGGGGRGTTLFMGSSSAQQATIDNQGGIFPINAYTDFSQSSTAGNALITNLGGSLSGVAGGFTNFRDQSTAGSATLLVAGGGVSGAMGGHVDFFAGTTAGSATLNVLGASVAGAGGGKLNFGEGSSAGSAQVMVQGSQSSSVGGPEGAVVSFTSYVTGGVASAGTASFTIGGNRFAFGTPGRVLINDGSTAADASFATQAGFDAGGRLSFEGTALHLSTAGNAHINNGSRATPSGSAGDFGGGTLFLAHSSADHATISNEAGRTAFGAQTVFRSDSTAANASIVNAGGLAGDTGGITFFQGSSNAGRAVIVSQVGALNASGLTRFADTSSAARASIAADGASVSGDTGGRVSFVGGSSAGAATLTAGGGSNGGAGGHIDFQQQATGGSARVVLGAGSTPGAGGTGGTLDISGVDTWLSVGSIEGGGQIILGNKSLIVGSNLASTTFAGVISGTAPPAFPSLAVLGGSLTLTGANVYAGRTSIGDGVNANSGKLVVANTTGSATGSGAVQVQRGGTLAGSGFIAGAVTLSAGGTIAPGDPVTLTLQDSLTWDGGGVIRLVLGADDAGSDHLVVHQLLRGAAGVFAFDLVDAGITAGEAYDLLSFDELFGFAASDFQAIGTNGTFALQDGRLAFTAASALAVPEPSTGALLLLGLVLIRGARRLRACSVRGTRAMRVVMSPAAMIGL